MIESAATSQLKAGSYNKRRNNFHRKKYAANSSGSGTADEGKRHLFMFISPLLFVLRTNLNSVTK
jgi:hypothetical protein